MCGGRELKVFGNDGKTTTTICKWTIAQLDEKQVVIEWSDVKENGNPKRDFKMSVERQRTGSSCVVHLQLVGSDSVGLTPYFR